MKIDSEIQAIIPATTLMEVLRLINDGIKEILVRINDEQISFGIGSIGLTSRLIDGKFIDYKQLIPTEADFTVTVDRNEFIRVVKVASIFAHSSAGSIVVKTSGENQELSVVTPASELGENNSSIEAEISGGNDGTISLNSKYLLDALNFIPSDKVNMRFSGKLSPVLLTGEKNDYNHIIMPVKY
jgi:DNA polymerase-3 subunit beta